MGDDDAELAAALEMSVRALALGDLRKGPRAGWRLGSMNGLDGPDDPVAARYPVPWAVSPPSSPSLNVPTAAEQVHPGVRAHAVDAQHACVPQCRAVLDRQSLWATQGQLGFLLSITSWMLDQLSAHYLFGPLKLHFNNAENPAAFVGRGPCAPTAASFSTSSSPMTASESASPRNSPVRLPQRSTTATNNVVHRDLKIENILISQTGNIKIIDFGLLSMYDAVGNLSTFCGSLYFAVPELLNAKFYTGPEVDIWSLGVVLYTLLCGKVPFKDESMPALHAKIKRGLVEYPVWLSAECKHLLSRMLVINPLRRASLSEIFAHPWMVRGFSAQPSTHLPAHTPLRTADIDPAVIARMAGFDFGADVEEVHAKLHDVLESDEYALAVLVHEHRRNGHATPEPPSMLPASPNNASKRRRFSGIDFYRRLRKRGTACHYVLCDAGGASTRAGLPPSRSRPELSKTSTATANVSPRTALQRAPAALHN
ncbi:kinase-like domain-containing protein [Mycena vulgaris]|nr:kinase-like domain-containing protein [Mycena vulgaris]